MEENIITRWEALLYWLRDGCVLPSLLSKYASDLVDENKPRSAGMERSKWTAVTAVVQSSAFLDVLLSIIMLSFIALAL